MHQCKCCSAVISTVNVTVNDLAGRPVTVAVHRCPTCDVRACKCGEKVFATDADKCPRCGRRLKV